MRPPWDHQVKKGGRERATATIGWTYGRGRGLRWTSYANADCITFFFFARRKGGRALHEGFSFYDVHGPNRKGVRKHPKGSKNTPNFRTNSTPILRTGGKWLTNHVDVMHGKPPNAEVRAAGDIMNYVHTDSDGGGGHWEGVRPRSNQPLIIRLGKFCLHLSLTRTPRWAKLSMS